MFLRNQDLGTITLGVTLLLGPAKHELILMCTLDSHSTEFSQSASSLELPESPKM